jgi:competence protein ComFC
LVLNEIFINLYKDFFSPQTCIGCGKLGSGYVCSDCLGEIEKVKDNICDYCGSKLPEGVSSYHLCGFCKNRQFMFYRLRSYGKYEGIIKKIIISYKYNKIFSLAQCLVDFLKELFKYAYGKEKIDFIDTVPDFQKGQESQYAKPVNREKNHMQIIASKLSDSLGIPYADNIIKLKKTVRQQLLNGDARIRNVKNIFKVKDPLLYYGKNILLIDDVITTGSTINEISKSMKRCMADKIFVITVARVN